MTARRTRLVAPVFLAAALSLCVAGFAQPADDLMRDFRNPPDSARPWVYWFWLNGNITREGISADLEAMARVGIGGVLIMEVDQGAPLGPIPFASDQWRELFAYMEMEAWRHGIEINMNNDAGWNGSGGPWITPDKSMQKVVWSETQVQGPARFQASLPQPETLAGYYREIAVLAFPTAGDYRIPEIQGKAAYERLDLPVVADYGSLPADQIIDRGRILDISANMDAEGRLTWEAPEGNWTVLRFGHTPTGAMNAPSPVSGRGLECDKLSKEGSQAAFEGLMGKLIAGLRPSAGRTLVATHIDSWENGSQNWTARFREEFQRLRGYDPLPWLPVMTGRVVGSLEVSERFLWDLRQTVSDLLVDNYAGHMREMANEYGLRLSIEAYGNTTVDNLAYAGRCDEPMGEFWWPGLGGTLAEMASAAHVYGKPICGAEAFTAADGERWLAHPGSIKAMGDRAFCLGINRFVFHRYAHQPWVDRRPGMSMGPWGLHYERGQTWWDLSAPWHEYLTRCQYMLRGGLPVVDLLYLAPEGAPRSFAPPPSILRSGYKADVCPAEVVLTRLKVENGLLTLPHGMTYRALVLPGSPAMSPQLLERLGELAAGGATTIGSAPRKAPGLEGYPECDARVRELAESLWGSGRIITGRSPVEVLKEAGVGPDFASDRSVDFIHRRIGEMDAYFVANPLRHSVNAACTFRVSGGVPALWQPETGVIEPVVAYTRTEGRTHIPLRLEAGGSVFVVFTPETSPQDPVLQVSRDGEVVWPARSKDVKITIRRAIWSPTQAGRRTRDVTRQVQRLVDGGVRSFVVADLISEGDPAPNVLKTLRVEYEAAGQALTAEATDPQRITFQEPQGAERINIRRALWGPAGEDVHGPKDVTAQVQRKVDGGESSFVVAELASEGDPAHGVVKLLRVDYEVEGRSLSAEASDPETISFQLPADAPAPVELRRQPGGKLVACVTEPGSYEAVTQSGRVLRFTGSAPSSLDITGPWDLRFTPGWGAPEQVALPELMPWNEHPDPGVRFFSGTASYRRTVRIPPDMLSPGRQVLLDLGRVEVIARVRLNGRDLGICWRAPHRLDITSAAVAGENLLEVEVTSLWPNRMIGDELLPEDSERHGNGTLARWPQWVQDDLPSPTGRYTFTSWRLWAKDAPLQPSGLIGPVSVLSSRVHEIGP